MAKGRVHRRPTLVRAVAPFRRLVDDLKLQRPPNLLQQMILGTKCASCTYWNICPRASVPLRRRRRATTEEDPTLLADLEALVAPGTRGDPQSPLRWTCKPAAEL